MLRRLRPRSIYDVCAAIALFVALGGTAYAVNTVGSTDIIDGQVKSVDIGDNEIGSADVKDNSINTFDVHSFLGVDVADGTLTSADVAPGTFVAGRGQLLSNRIVFTPSIQSRTLLVIPGLGQLYADCRENEANVVWSNNSGGPVDIWWDFDSSGRSRGTVSHGPSPLLPIVTSSSSNPALHTMSTTVSLGTGADPGPRKVATITVSALQEVNNNPCGFQVQGTLWTSP
jgi:hypothetical protein